MKTLKTLIRISKRELDERRKELALIEQRRDEFEGILKDLDKELAGEQKFLVDNTDVVADFALYLETFKKRRPPDF